MKRISFKSLMLAPFSALLLIGCNDDMLEETPRSTYTPEFFNTEAGINGGIAGMYAHLRYIYGNAYYYNSCETGTDEVTYGQSADGNFKDADLSGVGQLTPSTSRTDAIWGECFRNINTAMGVLEYGTAAGMSPSLLAEANFFRGFDYFLLVQTFGGVPLDLGAGELTFNTKPTTFSVRNTVSEVYTKAIFPDLVTAVENLPDMPRQTGTVTKTVARLYLAKAYLTYGWWLENPNNIPTYPETSRTDPDGHDAQWYYQKAYDIAVEGINNPGPYALQSTFYDVNWGPNDRNSEIMLYADHTEDSSYYNGGDINYGSGGAPDNFAGWMMTWNYTNLKSGATPALTDLKNSVQREADQKLGRPWVRMCPTIEVLTNTFNDKANDSRYDGTFTTTYRGNWDKVPALFASNPVLYNANGLPVEPGDAILSFLDDDTASVAYPSDAGTSGVGAGVLPGRADYVVEPTAVSRIVYPGLWKLGPYRTDNGSGLGQPNGGSTRPFNIAKFSELYFVAAEAAVKGATPQGGMSARELINVIRERAGKWRWDNGENAARIEDNSAAMVAATPAVIDIYYILAERSREYYGEGYRWFDLARTQTWAELASSYTICGAAYGNHTPVTVARTIQPYLYLRPIPQGQIDAMTGDKVAYQNPGYQ